MTISTAAAPVHGRSRVFLGLSLGYFMVLLDTTVLTIALPDLARSLGGSVAGQQWAVNGYTVASAALLLTAGAVADRLGAHRVFRAGMVVFGLSSPLCALAPALWVLVLLRGLLGAACLPSSLSAIVRLYPDAAARARAMGAWAAITGVALAAGPVAGGLLVAAGGWRAVFVVNVPIAALGLVLTAGRGIVAPRGDRAIDGWAQALAIATLGLGTDAVIAHGARSLVTGPLAVLALVALVLRERRSPAPALPPAVLRAPGVLAGLLTGAAVNVALSGALFVLTLVLLDDRQLSPLAAGLAFLPLTLPTAINPVWTGRIVARSGPRRPVLAGLALLTAGTAGLSCAAARHAPYPVLAVALAVLGTGVSFALPALVAAVTTAAPAGRAGTAGGLLNAARQAGASLGVAALGPAIAAWGDGWALLPAAGLLAVCLGCGCSGYLSTRTTAKEAR